MKQYDLSTLQTNVTMVEQVNSIIFSLIGNYPMPKQISSNPTYEELSTVNELIKVVADVRELASVANVLSSRNMYEIINLPMTLIDPED
ncbi:hypothetical protein WKK_05340 [Weissella koreensis KACC 15510]|uniref:hypothetical protein n=1 Tax=Weissella koreensis TaxID=165096 RepID=UPI000217504C|nr:hypothetical protein [Weissella koreensis]AEJ23939.1 hypothetical protein WKK_05340 [Weissella koreensis KACC 15510]